MSIEALTAINIGCTAAVAVMLATDWFLIRYLIRTAIAEAQRESERREGDEWKDA